MGCRQQALDGSHSPPTLYTHVVMIARTHAGFVTIHFCGYTLTR
jgi:hypothetical protein